MSLLSLIPFAEALINAFSKNKETKQAIKAIKNAGAIKLAQTKVDAQLRLAADDANSAGNLDEITLKTVGWKDEYLMIIITIPTILAFFPGMVQYVTAGFEALEKMPLYYQYALGGVYIYVFGFKRVLLKMFESKFGK